MRVPDEQALSLALGGIMDDQPGAEGGEGRAGSELNTWSDRRFTNEHTWRFVGITHLGLKLGVFAPRTDLVACNNAHSFEHVIAQDGERRRAPSNSRSFIHRRFSFNCGNTLGGHALKSKGARSAVAERQPFSKYGE